MKRILSVVLVGLLLMPVAWAPNAAADDAVVEAQAAEGALGLTREQRSQIQEALAERGFDVGPADGSFGPRTREAIRAWQHGYKSGVEGATGYLNTSQAQLLLGGSGESRRSIRPRQSAQSEGPSFDETVAWLQETLEHRLAADARYTYGIKVTAGVKVVMTRVRGRNVGLLEEFNLMDVTFDRIVITDNGDFEIKVKCKERLCMVTRFPESDDLTAAQAELTIDRWSYLWIPGIKPRELAYSIQKAFRHLQKLAGEKEDLF